MNNTSSVSVLVLPGLPLTSSLCIENSFVYSIPQARVCRVALPTGLCPQLEFEVASKGRRGQHNQTRPQEPRWSGLKVASASEVHMSQRPFRMVWTLHHRCILGSRTHLASAPARESTSLLPFRVPLYICPLSSGVGSLKTRSSIHACSHEMRRRSLSINEKIGEMLMTLVGGSLDYRAEGPRGPIKSIEFCIS